MTKVIDAEIVDVSEETALAAFNGTVKLQDILDHVAVEARAFNGESETLTGRKEITSMAYKVSRSKTLIDNVGKDIVSEWKKRAKTIDAQRKMARDFLDTLRDEVRQPVTDWENEQKRLQEEAIQKDADEQAARLAELERREAELKAREDAEKEKAAAEQAGKDRIEREAQIAKNAAERAKREAEEKAEHERTESARREREAVEAKERAERKAKEVAELAALRAEEAKRQAERESAEAVEREKARVQAEKEQEEAAERARASDKRHKASVNNLALAALNAVGLKDSEAKAVVIAIAKGQIPHVRIMY